MNYSLLDAADATEESIGILFDIFNISIKTLGINKESLSEENQLRLQLSREFYEENITKLREKRDHFAKRRDSVNIDHNETILSFLEASSSLVSIAREMIDNFTSLTTEIMKEKDTQVSIRAEDIHNKIQYKEKLLKIKNDVIRDEKRNMELSSIARDLSKIGRKRKGKEKDFLDKMGDIFL